MDVVQLLSAVKILNYAKIRQIFFLITGHTENILCLITSVILHPKFI